MPPGGMSPETLMKLTQDPELMAMLGGAVVPKQLDEEAEIYYSTSGRVGLSMDEVADRPAGQVLLVLSAYSQDLTQIVKPFVSVRQQQQPKSPPPPDRSPLVHPAG